MSDIEFQEYELPLEERWFQASQFAVRDMTITSDAYRLLCYLCSNSKTWENYSNYIRKLFVWGEARLTAAIKSLHNSNYIRRERIRKEDGRLGHYKYQYCQKPVFKNESWEVMNKKSSQKPEMLPKVDENQPKPEALQLQGAQPYPTKPGMDSPAVASPDLPMPNKPMPKSNMAMKAMPSYQKGSKAMEASPGKQDPSVRGRRHKRPEDEENRFQWLLGLDLLDEKGLLNEDSLSYLAHKYSQEKLERTYFHLVYKLDQKQVPIKKSPLAFYRYLLDNEHNCRASHAELNEAMARKFASELGWGSLEFKEKYVIDRNCPSKDIDFNLEPATFKDLLTGLYMSLNSNYGT